MNYFQLYKSAVAEILTSTYKKDAAIDPAMNNRIMITVRAYFVVYCYVSTYINQKTDIPLSLNDCMELFKEILAEENPFLYIYEKTDRQVNVIADYYLKQLDNESLSCDVGSMYETLLKTDISENSIIDGELLRNKQGSYYTPIELASYLTKSVIDNYIQNNNLEELKNARIIDFSCGSGIFLTEALRYISKLLHLSEQQLSNYVCNLYACDVDFIALEICKFNLMDLIQDTSVYKKLSMNFRQANFLLETAKEKNVNVKIDAYLNGLIYHSSLAIGTDFLTEYDIILGNPPWEKIRFEEKNFYAQYESSIRSIYFKPELQHAILNVESSNNVLANYCNIYKQQIANAKLSIKKTNRFRSSSNGELNTSSLFTEAAYRLLSKKGSMGLIVKSSTVATTASKPLFDLLNCNIYSIIDFINKKKIFNIDSRERFALLMIDSLAHEDFRLAMNIQSVSEIEDKMMTITKDSLLLLNPSTGMIPNLTSSKDLSILLSFYENNDPISNIFPNLKYGRIVHFTNHADDIDREKKPDNLPVYEGKFFSSFDGSYAGFNHVAKADRYKAKAHASKLSYSEKKNNCYPESRFFIKENKWHSLSASYHSEYMLAWHSLTSATNSRACVATILPFMPASQSVQFLTADSSEDLIFLCCLFNSVVFDYIVKNKLTGIDLTQSFIKQIAIPSIDKSKKTFVSFNGTKVNIHSFLYSICWNILNSDRRLNNLWHQNQHVIKGLPSERKSLILLMDALVAILYRISSDDYKYILGSYSDYSEKEIQEILNFITCRES